MGYKRSSVQRLSDLSPGRHVGLAFSCCAGSHPFSRSNFGKKGLAARIGLIAEDHACELHVLVK